MKIEVITALTLALGAYSSGELLTRHTNIKCKVLEKSYVEMPVCHLKVLGRGIIGASVTLKSRKLPIKSAQVNFSVWKKLSGYHPFLFNVTVDFCRQMKHPNPYNVFYYFYMAMKPYINMNHTCPITHDLILKDFVLDDKMFLKFPGLQGNYMFMIKIAADDVWIGTIYSYLDIYVGDVAEH